MKRWSLDLELLDEVILSRRAASLGGHRSLGHIPGAALLGAAAAALYGKLDDAAAALSGNGRLGRRDAWTAFHSGRVRFGDGLPLSPKTGDLGWPVPACWHHAKGTEVGSEGWFGKGIYNLMHCENGELPGDEPGRQPKQLREVYVTERGERLRPETGFRMRTAIAPETGRAAEAQLFGFESLAAGQHFRAALDLDDEVPESVAAALRDFFSGAVLLLGRSRSAQFGRVRCTLAEAPAPLPASGEPAGQELTLWLLSDLATVDAEGLSTLTPGPEDLGLPPGRVREDKTYARFRAYSPYNGHHRLYGRERQVIAAGSVLCFKLDTEPGPAQWAEMRVKIAAGLGLYREAGLGRCVAAPELLAAKVPSFEPFVAGKREASDERGGASARAVAENPYARWLQRLAEDRDAETVRKEWAEKAVRELDELERHARALNGLAQDQPAGPGKSQWGRVAEAAKAAARKTDAFTTLHEALFDVNKGICKRPKESTGTQSAEGRLEDWYLATQSGDLPTSYAGWLHGKLADREDRGDAAVVIGLLAELAQKRLAAQGRTR